MDDFANDPPLQPKKDKVRIKIKREEREYYPKLFDLAKTKGTNKVSGDEAVRFFRKSRLSPETLSKIWSLAAQTNQSFMDRDEFYVAIRLVALAQSKREVSLASVVRNVDCSLPYFDGIPMPKIAPSTNPSASMMNPGMNSGDTMNSGMMNAATMNAAMMNAAMMNAAMMNPAMMNAGMMNTGMMGGDMPMVNMPNTGMMNTGMTTGMTIGMMESGAMPSMVEIKTSPYLISQKEAEKFSRIFDAVDKARIGSITADQMTLLLKNTKLPDEVLGQVWELADTDSNGNFNKADVITILHLLIKHKGGLPIPQSIPSDLKSAVQSFLKGQPIMPPAVAQSTPAVVPIVPAIMPAASDPSDPFAAIESGPALSMYNMPAMPSMPATGMSTGSDMVSESIKSALQELQVLNPEKEKLKNSIAIYREMLTKEEETLNAQMTAFRDVAAEYNDLLKKVSGTGGAVQPTGHYGASNGNSNWNANPSSFDFS
jgi:hypothetical protein